MNAKRESRKSRIVELDEKWSAYPVFSIFDVFDYACHTAFYCIEMHSELVNTFLEYYNGLDNKEELQSREAIRKSVQKLFETTSLKDQDVGSQDALVEELYSVLHT